jgi:DNA-binding XRE family transcriptional regulator
MVLKNERGRGRPRVSENALSKWIDGSGMTREQVAKSLGIPKPSLDRICRDERRPNLDLAFQIERVTGGNIPAKSWAAKSRRTLAGSRQSRCGATGHIR